MVRGAVRVSAIFEAVAIDRSVSVLVRVVDGKAIATVVMADGYARNYSRLELSSECRAWAFSGKTCLHSTLLDALYAMPLPGEKS